MQSYKDIDISAIKMDNKVTLKNSSHGVLIKLVQGNGSPVIFQTPLMSLAWDTRVRLQPDGSTTTCNLPLSFGTSNPNVLDFKLWLEKFRTHAKGMIQANALDWYGKALNDMQIEEYLSVLIKEPPADSTYSPTFLPKVAHSQSGEKDYSIDIKVFSIDKTEVSPDTLKKGNRVGAIISIPYIHIGKGNKSLSIRCDVNQCVVLPTQVDTTFGFDVSADPDLVAAAEAAESKKRKIDSSSIDEASKFTPDAPDEHTFQFADVSVPEM